MYAKFPELFWNQSKFLSKLTWIYTEEREEEKGPIGFVKYVYRPLSMSIEIPISTDRTSFRREKKKVDLRIKRNLIIYIDALY